MSVKFPYKKQATLGIIGIAILLLAIETDVFNTFQTKNSENLTSLLHDNREIIVTVELLPNLSLGHSAIRVHHRCERL